MTGNQKYPKNLQTYLTDFDNKKSSVRENSLTSLVNSLTLRPHHTFVESNHITLCHTCLTRLTCTKKGSNKFSKVEICRAVRALSLVGIHILDQHCAQQMFEECLPVLTDALVRFRKDVEVVLEVVECLGMVGFFGSSNSMEVEKVMLVVWEFMVSAGEGDDLKACVLGAAVSCWTFLLSSLCKQHLSKKHWRKCVAFFSRLLERKEGDEGDDGYDEDVVLGARTALGLILEFDSIDIFSDECKEGVDQSLEDEIVSKLESSSSSKTGNMSQNIQMKVMKKFLGKDGFGCHMKENENFHRLFESVSRNKGKKVADGKVDHAVPEREEVVVKFFHREVERRQVDDLLPFVSEKEKKVQYRMGKSPSSALNKARTQLLNKQRKVVNPDFVEGEDYD